MTIPKPFFDKEPNSISELKEFFVKLDQRLTALEGQGQGQRQGQPDSTGTDDAVTNGYTTPSLLSNPEEAEAQPAEVIVFNILKAELGSLLKDLHLEELAAEIVEALTTTEN
jgi:hypothetical protein